MIYKRCGRADSKRRCKGGQDCPHPWYFRHQSGRIRISMPIDDYALPRMAPEARHPVRSKGEAKDWDVRIRADILSGVDPRRAPGPARPTLSELTVGGFLDLFYKEHVVGEGLNGLQQAKSLVAVISRSPLGARPLSVLNRADEIQAFRAGLAGRYKVSYVNRLLELIREAINWGRGQTPPYLTAQPFHKWGITVRKKNEIKRDRRISRAEEQRLLETALLPELNAARHRFAGPRLHDAIIANLEMPIRIGELVPIRNMDVDWESHQVTIIVEKGDGSRTTRRVPFDPEGRLAAILERRGKLSPLAHVFGMPGGERVDADGFRSGWETLRLLANGHDAKKGPHGTLTPKQTAALKALDLHWHDLRHESACRLWRDGVDIRTIQLMLGHSTLSVTQRYLNVTDVEVRQRMQENWDLKKQKRLRVVEAASA
jgi:integrase